MRPSTGDEGLDLSRTLPRGRFGPRRAWRPLRPLATKALDLDHETLAQRGQEAAPEGRSAGRAVVGGPKVHRPGRWVQTGTQRGARSQERRLTTGVPHATASTERPQLPGAETCGL